MLISKKVKIVITTLLLIETLCAYGAYAVIHLQNSIAGSENCRQCTARTIKALADVGIKSTPVYGVVSNECHAWVEIKTPFGVISINNGEFEDMSEWKVYGEYWQALAEYGKSGLE